jgi:hypothetical protein
MIKKLSPNLPLVGDRVKLRGREPTGTVHKINDIKWVHVEWDEGSTGPTICHLFELEKINEIKN